ncbi:universal stress protein [Aquibium sp. ELW1220]|uniref:universal stress protein n=1 Tax=Aquibium sp. ELW1220 TaxID=2976766 RepID=UPI0025B18E78|nr:universal stress protein [Aquibium sp. ELW1220]MDN2581269.1 universal stress protein [Aquibium sp. ELW1220]
MYSRILVPIDLHDDAKAKAMIDAARHLGGQAGQIVLLHVVEDIPSYVAVELPSGILAGQKDDSIRRLEDLSQRENLKAVVDVRIGQPASAILAGAEEHGSDVIVIASHRPGFQDYLIGSTAARVVRHSRCSVLVIR